MYAITAAERGLNRDGLPVAVTYRRIADHDVFRDQISSPNASFNKAMLASLRL